MSIKRVKKEGKNVKAEGRKKTKFC